MKDACSDQESRGTLTPNMEGFTKFPFIKSEKIYITVEKLLQIC